MFAAIIGGFFSLITLISSKEQKVSEFRQEWINSLRESVSSYVASLYYLSTLYKHYLDQDPKKQNRFEMTKGVAETYSTVNKTYNDIVFRVNGNEKKQELRELNINPAIKYTNSCCVGDTWMPEIRTDSLGA